MDIQQSSNQPLRELALFAGAGGGILGGKLLGWQTVCAVENEPYCAALLAARQNDGTLPPFPIWDDVRTFRGTPWKGVVDVVSGGFPCQDISAAGKGEGINGARSGLWREMARIIGEVRPLYCLVENSPILTSKGLGLVLGHLASMGCNAKWGVLGAADAIWDFGDPVADHLRNRIWIAITYPTSNTTKLQCNGGKNNPRIGMGGKQISKFGNGNRETTIPYSNGTGCNEMESSITGRTEEEKSSGKISYCGSSGRRTWWKSEPDVGRMADGVAFRVDRLKAIGNGQVPAVVELAWKILMGK